MSGRSRISLRTVRLVANKELLEALRDRRTLFVALILPVLLYPLVMLGVAPLVSRQKQKLQDQMQKIVVTGGGRQAVIDLVLTTPEAAPEGSDSPDDPDAVKPVGLDVVERDDPRAALTAGDISLWIDVGEGFEEAVRGERTGQLKVYRDTSEDLSRVAWLKWDKALARAERGLLDDRLAARDLDPGFRDPVKVTELVDVATAARRGAYMLGKMLALLLVVMTLSGSFYPAVDSVAGEKERGTMETLLVAPCGRAELVLGKFVAVMAVTLAAAILNLVSMGLTMGPLMSGLKIPGLEGIQVSPVVMLGILALLVPLAALFSALSLALSTMARSVKEAQHYLTPMFLVVMPLAMVVVIPNVPLSKTLAAVPITNAVLFFRDLMLGKADVVTAVVVITTTLGFAALALWACVMLFLKEETLFRGPEGTGSLISRPAPERTPRAASAVFLFAAALSLIWYAQPLLSDVPPLWSAVLTQVSVVLLPCLVLAWWMRIDWGETFRLRTPKLLPLLLAAPIGLCAPVLNGALHRWLFANEAPSGAFRELEKQFIAMFESHSAVVLVLVIGVLPAVCEELFFRGFLLSGFRRSFTSRRGVWTALAVSAVLFGLFHIYPEKWIATGLMGAVVAYLVVRSGSLLPAMIAHACNNGSLVLHQKLGEGSPLTALFGGEEGSSTVAIVAAAVVLFGSLGVLVATGRPLDAPGGDSPRSTGT